MDGFEFSGQGELQRIDTFVSKAGKNILTLIIDVPGQYPQLVPVKVFGRLAESADEWQPGDKLQISGRLGGRDWNGKVYPDIVATMVEVLTTSQRSAGGPRSDPPDPDPANGAPYDNDDVPF
jgi:single-stranded DNA-binding protein